MVGVQSLAQELLYAVGTAKKKKKEREKKVSENVKELKLHRMYYLATKELTLKILNSKL